MEDAQLKKLLDALTQLTDALETTAGATDALQDTVNERLKQIEAHLRGLRKHLESH